MVINRIERLGDVQVGHVDRDAFLEASGRLIPRRQKDGEAGAATSESALAAAEKAVLYKVHRERNLDYCLLELADDAREIYKAVA